MSVINICNQALNEAGARSTIAALDEQSSEAIQCNLRYETTRDQLLQLAHWDFCKQYTTPSLLKAAPGTPENTAATGVWSDAWPPPPWFYSYARPTDCLLIRAVLPQPYAVTSGPNIFPYSNNAPATHGQAARFSRGLDTDSNGTKVKAIFTNQEKAILCYNAKVADTTLFEPAFTSALIVALASNLVYNLTGDRRMEIQLTQKANSMIMAARLHDANESLDVIDNTPDWLQARGVPIRGQAQGWMEPFGPLFGGV